MNLVSKVKAHERLFEIKPSMVSKSFKSMLTELDSDQAAALHIEGGNHIDSNGEVHSSRVSLVAVCPRASLVERAFGFIDTKFSVPEDISRFFLEQAQQYTENPRSDSGVVMGYDERSDNLRFKIAGTVVKNEDTLKQTQESMSPLAQSFMELSYFRAQAYDFCFNPNTQETKIIPKFYFASPSRAVVKDHADFYKQRLSGESMSLIEQSSTVYFSFVGSSDEIHLSLRPKLMHKFLNNSVFNGSKIHDLRKKYQQIGQSIWSVTFLDKDAQSGALRYINSYCTYMENEY